MRHSKKHILIILSSIAIISVLGLLIFSAIQKPKSYVKPDITSEDQLPNNIFNQVPVGYEVMTYLGGELNDDKLIDYLVVLHKKKEIETFEETREGSPRPLLIFIQNIDRTFALASKNDQVVFAINEGGQCDPFEDGEDGLVINKHYFTVQNSVACGQHWNDYITFKYNANLKNWIFHKESSESWKLNDSDAPDADALVSNGRSETRADKSKPILFERFVR